MAVATGHKFDTHLAKQIPSTLQTMVSFIALNMFKSLRVNLTM